jgi:4-alpha-glucanotransferase
MMSPANLVIIPIQDLLGLGEETRINRPAIAKGNWEWRLTPKELSSSVKKRLMEMTKTYGRC